MKQRILYIGNKLATKGNTVSSIETLGVFLKQEGHTVYTASSKQNKVLRLADMLWSTYSLRKEIDFVLIDTYSTLNFHFAVAVASLCRRLNIPYIPILRGGDLPARLVKSKRASQNLFNNAAVNIAPSNYLLNAFNKQGIENVRYIPNTIELKNYPFLKREHISARLLWVRSFSEIYNPLLALKIVEQLIAENIEVTLTMVGPEKDGSLSACKEYAQKNKLPVTFTGKLSKKDWIALSSKHDIFINTTNFDNTPVSVIEAMALGMPVISTNVGGLPDLIENSENGILIPPKDVKAFVTQIKLLLKKPEVVTKLSTNARQLSKQFDWQEVKKSWVLVFNKLL